LTEQAGFAGEFEEDCDVMSFKFSAFEIFESGPGEFSGDGDFAIMGMATVFIRHFKENEISELFEVIAVADAVVAEGSAEAPDFGYDGIGGH